MALISAIYPNTAGSGFDRAYYLDRHAPFAKKMLAPHGLISIRATLGTAALDGGPPPFWAISEMVFSSREAFETAMAACGEALFSDTAVYTNTTPILQFSTLPGDPDTISSGD